MVSVGDGKDILTINSQFLIVPCRNVCNYILRRPFAATLDLVRLLMHLKLEYHNLQGEPTTINVNLKGAKRIYQALWKDQGEGVVVEINVASITGYLNRMGIRPPRSG